MQNESELWYPNPMQPPERADDSGADAAPKLPEGVQLSHSGDPQESAAGDDTSRFGQADQSELAALIRERADIDREAQQLASQVALSNDFDDALGAVLSGAEATNEARQAFAKFDPRDPDPQAFEFRTYVSTEYEKFGYF